ncbi:MAG: hypothetical protein Q8J78_16630 [Moraxellaceae bacterium]|nr:hypothetical protein [Moraxellaceae bacterium]
MKFFKTAGLVLGLALGTAPVLAQAALELKTQAFHEVVVVGKDGKTERKREELKKALPGQEVIYDITYRNTGSKPAEKVVVSNPIPAELVYQPGSAAGAGSKFEVSVDGGEAWGALETLKVPGPDGQPRPAVAADVTHLRWTVLAPVKAGAQGKFTYRAKVK